MLNEDLIRAQLLDLPYHEVEALYRRMMWLAKARPAQRLPAAIETGLKNTWLIISGRGFGKTRTGAEETWWPCWRNPGWIWGVIAPTHNDLNKTAFNGESGLISVIPPSIIADYNKSEMTITLINKSKIMGYSAEEPERLRGPNFNGVWMDEWAAWKYMKKATDNINFALRLGEHPIKIITTTPKPFRMIREQTKDAHTEVTRGSTYDNRANLAKSFFDEIVKYEGTDIGKQEIYGTILDFQETGIIKRSWLNLWPSDKAFPKLHYVLQSYDTAIKEKQIHDPSACTVWGIFRPTDNSPYAAMLLDCWDERMSYPILRQRVGDDAGLRYGPNDTPVSGILIEDKASGQQLIQEFTLAGAGARKVPVFPYNPGRLDKVARLNLASPYARQGLIWVPESAKFPGEVRKWAEPFVEQLCEFGPDTIENEEEHDDYVDTFSQAVAYLRDLEWLKIASDPVIPRDPAEEPPPRVNPYAA